MSGAIEVRPDPAHPAGHALIRVGGAARAGVDPRFRIQREGWERGVLGPDGWQVGDTLLEPDSVAVDGSDLVLHVGPAVSNHLESDIYVVTVPAANAESPVFWPHIAPLYSGSGRVVDASTSRLAPSQTNAGAEPAVVPKAGPTGVEQTRSPGAFGPASSTSVASAQSTLTAPAKPKHSAWPLIAALVLILALAGGGGWWGWRYWPEIRDKLALNTPPPSATPPSATSPSATPPVAPKPPEAAPPPPAPKPAAPPLSAPKPPEPPPAPPVVKPSEPAPAPPPAPVLPGPPPAPSAPPAPPPPPPPLSLDNLSVTEVIARASSPAEIQGQAERRLQGARKDDGLLLLEAAADRGHAPAMGALARLYDPNSFRPGGPIPSPDARQSARYYRDAARAGDSSIAEARNALRALLERRAQGGDLAATLTLKDFWP